jgi:unsaturated rhamnogalacturonyl hydrolase
MKIFRFLIVAIALSACTTLAKNDAPNDAFVQEDVPLYVRMADSEIARNPDPRLLEFRTTPRWEYTNGLECLAIFRVWEATNDDKYLSYVKFYADSILMQDGTILTYKQTDYNIDRINPGRVLLELNKVAPKEKYLKAIETLRDQMREHPRTLEGGFWHKKIYPYQMWLDGLYMGSPFLSQYAIDMKEPDLTADVANQIRLMDKHTYSDEAKLFYHAWDESKQQQWANQVTGQSPEFWGRSMGWFAMALVDILDYVPSDHPSRKDILEVVQKTAEGIVKYQDEQTGVWWQILNKPEVEGNYREASCSSMFSYFLLKAANKGYIGSEYYAAATKSFEGIVKEFIVENEDGTISLTHVCAVAGLGGNPYRDGSFQYYVGEPQRDNDPKGVGPFMMASIEFEKFKVL